MRFNKNSIAVLAVYFVFIVLGLIGPIVARAATTPSLGTAATYGILTGTFNYNVGLTTITGVAGTAALGYAVVAQGGGASLTVTGTTQVNNLAWSTAGTDQGIALTALSAPAQPCGNGTTIPGFTFADGPIDLATDTTHGTIRYYSPGVYCVTGAMAIGTAGIVLDSAGTYIFRSTGAFDTTIDSVVSLSPGVSACDVFWTPGAATTLAANTTFVGTIIDNAGITIGNTVSWTGRALAYNAGSGVVTANTDTITVPTCTAATLKLVKEVTNNSGAATTSAAWILTATGAGGFSDNGGTGTFHEVTAGVGYALSESTIVGYTPGSWSCDGGSLSGSTITLSLGQNVTCTITNDDDAATLIVKKIVVNDNGGTLEVENFSFSVNAGAAQVFEADGQNDLTVNAGTYTVTESAVVGYLTSYDNCSGLVIANGGSATCTITNDDIASGGSRYYGTINVVKVVINDNSGTKTVAGFPLAVNGMFVASGVTNTFGASLGETFQYKVTEINDLNYTRVFSGDCDAGGVVYLNPNDNKFCIITNNDIGAPVVVPPVPPLIDVVKVPEPLALPAGPGPVIYTYTLRNIGTVPVTNITMVGDTCSPIILASGDINADAKLDISEAWVYRCSTTLSATHTNTITATGWANGISAVDIASATVVVGAPVVPPLIHVAKVPSPLTLSAPGGAVTYTYTVTNPGTAPLSNVSIADDKCTGLPGRVSGHPGDVNKNDLLESNETWSFTCQSNLTQTTTNTGTAEGSANGLIARDFAIAIVVVADPGQVLPKAAATVVPGLPNAGFYPLEESIIWSIIIPIVALILVLASLIVVIKKRII
ncbi:MAG: ice-binding family protein [bacterium]|nr:ice-binding family protein [bacterium]